MSPIGFAREAPVMLVIPAVTSAAGQQQHLKLCKEQFAPHARSYSPLSLTGLLVSRLSRHASPGAYLTSDSMGMTNLGKKSNPARFLSLSTGTQKGQEDKHGSKEGLNNYKETSKGQGAWQNGGLMQKERPPF